MPMPEPMPRAMLPTGRFHTTRWTQVVRAKSVTTEGREALRDLCGAYYGPVVSFLRREVSDPAQAQELAHEFFEGVLAGSAFGGADRVQGRFRSYLLGAIKHFLSNRREAEMRLRRGAGVKPLSLDAAAEAEAEGAPVLQIADDGQMPPDLAFDRQWALTVLTRSLAALREECADGGQDDLFNQLQGLLTGDADHGEQQALAEQLGMNLNTLKSTLRRLRQRFRILMKMEISRTLENDDAVADEMDMLMAALRSR